MSMTATENSFHLPEPPTGASVWAGRDMGSRTDWINHLNAATLSVLEGQVDRFLSSGQALAQMTRQDMAAPALIELTDTWREELLRGRGFLLARGMPVGDWSHEKVAAAYYGLGLLLGVLLDVGSGLKQ